MANLMTKTKYINICIRKKDIDIREKHNLILEWCKKNCEFYCFIYHVNDINPLTNEIETPHLHMVLTMLKVQRISTILNSITDYLHITTLGVMIDKTDSYEGSLQYLLHLNDKQKTPHEFNELYHNYIEEELKVILSTSSDKLTFERVYSICRNANCISDVIKFVGLGRYHVYRNTIRDIFNDTLRERGLFLKDNSIIVDSKGRYHNENYKS